MNWVAAILTISVLIWVHELGHYLLAKWNGVRVLEFAIGFGPKLWSKKIGDTIYSVRLFLFLGGFNRMAGMEPDEPDAPASGDDTDDARPRAVSERVPQHEKFNAKAVGQRSAIIVAGPIANLLLAVLLFALVFGPVGIQRPSDEPVIGAVMPGRPAAVAGLQPGDRILTVEGQAIADWAALVRVVQRRLDMPTRIAYQRGDRRGEVRVVPAARDDQPAAGMIGIQPALRRVQLAPADALAAGVRQTVDMAGSWFQSIGLMLRRQAPADLVGPIGIVQVVSEASASGAAYLLYLAGALSVTLAIINLLPFPALDGGRLVFLLFERLRGRPVDPARENFIHFVGFALLILLAVFISLRDIQRIAS